MLIQIAMCLIPIVVMGFMAFTNGKRFTSEEYIVGALVGVLLAVGSFHAAKHLSVTDTEHWNGRITKKISGTESCCHCRTVCDARDDDGNCTRSHEECDHSMDYWWGWKFSTGDTLKPWTCEGSSRDPKRWVNSEVGEAAAVAHSYKNYLYADPNSILIPRPPPGMQGASPKRPQIHDHYRVNNAIGLSKAWNAALMEWNADWGAKKQITLVVVKTDHRDPLFTEKIAADWLYGAKNQLTLVLGTSGSDIAWARAFSFSSIEDLEITVRDDLPKQGFSVTDHASILGWMEPVVLQQYDRDPMSDLEYLFKAAKPPTWFLVLEAFLLIAASFIYSFVAIEKDLFGGSSRRRF